MNDDARAFRDELAAEDSVDADATIVAEGDWFGPGVALFEEYMLEVLRDEAVLNRIAVVVKGLMHVISPFPTQQKGSAVEDLIELHEQLYHLRV